MQWLINNKAMSHEAAVQKVEDELPLKLMYPIASDTGMWNPRAMCDGKHAADRARFLVSSTSITPEDAIAEVMKQFPAEFAFFFEKCASLDGHWIPNLDCDGFRAELRSKWLEEWHGKPQDDARQQVIQEFPVQFATAVSGGSSPTVAAASPTAFASSPVASTPSTPTTAAAVSSSTLGHAIAEPWTAETPMAANGVTFPSLDMDQTAAVLDQVNDGFNATHNEDTAAEFPSGFIDSRKETSHWPLEIKRGAEFLEASVQRQSAYGGCGAMAFRTKDRRCLKLKDGVLSIFEKRSEHEVKTKVYLGQGDVEECMLLRGGRRLKLMIRRVPKAAAPESGVWEMKTYFFLFDSADVAQQFESAISPHCNRI